MNAWQILLGLYAFGLVGSYLTWLAWIIEFEDYRCPTPRAIILMILSASTILLPWGPALAGWIGIWGRRQNWNWFTQPICRR